MRKKASRKQRNRRFKVKCNKMKSSRFRKKRLPRPCRFKKKKRISLEMNK